MIKSKYSYLTIALLTSTLLTAKTHASIIDLSYNVDSFSDAKGLQALAGFQEAANFWATTLTDDVTINIDIGFSALAVGILGSANSSQAVFSYQDVALSLVNDATSTTDISVTSSLSCDLSQPNDAASSGVCALQFLDQEGDTNSPGLDNDGTIDNIALALSQANAKALGFTEDSFGQAFTDSDGTITFSSNAAFDFDNTDGIDTDKIDFVGIAIHEIGHVLGFISGVDTYDVFYNSFDNLFDLDPFAISSALDLFRCSEESFALGSGILDWQPGSDAYFSIDGCVSEIADFSTGEFGGDGYQASHFKDNLGLGILDPTLSPGEFGFVSINDLIAFDAIGWDLLTTEDIPEPSSFALFILAITGLFSSRRKNTRSEG